MCTGEEWVLDQDLPGKDKAFHSKCFATYEAIIFEKKSSWIFNPCAPMISTDEFN